MIFSGVGYNLFEGVYNDVVLILEANGHSYNDPSQGCGAAATQS